MRGVVACVVALAAVLAATPSLSRDLGVSATAAASPSSWTGLYAGGHVGGGWSPLTYYDPAFPTWKLSHTPAGAIGGAQAGYNFQFGPWVIGVEGDVAWSGMKDRVIDNNPPIGAATFAGDIFEAKVRWIGLVTGRLGYAWDRLLIYAKGGAAWANSELHFQFVQVAGFGPTKLRDTREGWTVGGGVEYAFAPHWSAKLEYNYVDFGRSGLVTYLPLPDGFVATFAQELHLAKAGVNYRFGL
jgi:outer membrane immunogenic protein